MIDTPANVLPENRTARTELARESRRIFLARESTEHHPTSVSEEDELAALVESVRSEFGPHAISEDDIQEIVATERNRVADAITLADALAPRIAKILQRSASVSPSPSSVTPLQPAAPSTVSSTPTGKKPFAANTPVPGIADLIEGMLDMERAAPPRPNLSRQR